jgi:hypothetical protein
LFRKGATVSSAAVEDDSTPAENFDKAAECRLSPRVDLTVGLSVCCIVVEVEVEVGIDGNDDSEELGDRG